jgi:hypothetical protein
VTSSYPTSLDAISTGKTDGTSTGSSDHAGHHNDLADAVNKIEAELGTNPSGAAADVATRLSALNFTSFFVATVTIDVPSTAAHTSGSLTASGFTPALATSDYVIWAGIGSNAGVQFHFYTSTPICTIADQITVRYYNADTNVNDPASATHYFLVFRP